IPNIKGDLESSPSGDQTGRLFREQLQYNLSCNTQFPSSGPGDSDYGTESIGGVSFAQHAS
ncbi:MAG: hypothetical protein ACK5FS_14135, partial [Planctomycetota bacterium]